jgi:hypothetical protein
VQWFQLRRAICAGGVSGTNNERKGNRRVLRIGNHWDVLSTGKFRRFIAKCGVGTLEFAALADDRH